MAKKQEFKEEPKRQKRGYKLPAAERNKIVNFTLELYLKGYSYRAIAQEIEANFNRVVSFVAVGGFVSGLIKDWRKERIDKLDDMKTVELQRINKLENTYWEAWTRSMESYKKTTEKQKAAPGKSVGKDGEIKESMNVMHAEKTVINNENMHGDPRYLAGVQWCIAMRCKILGVEAPIEFKGTMTSEIKRTTVFKTRTRKAKE